MDKISKIINLKLDKINSEYHQELKEEIGDLLVNDILRYTSRAQSPVYGNSFPGLNERYKKIKIKKGGKGIANLRLEGDLMASLTWQNHPAGIEIGIFDDSQTGKADGHCNFSGLSKLPVRRFIPDENEDFCPEIKSKVEKIINRYIELSNADNFLKDVDLADILANIKTIKESKKEYVIDVILKGYFEVP